MNLLTSIASADGAIAGAATGFRLLDWVLLSFCSGCCGLDTGLDVEIVPQKTMYWVAEP